VINTENRHPRVVDQRKRRADKTPNWGISESNTGEFHRAPSR
jgi:hypothetical protein